MADAISRADYNEDFSDNPGMRPRIPEAIARGYRRARSAAANKTELDETIFAENCFYGFDDIMTREFVL